MVKLWLVSVGLPVAVMVVSGSVVLALIAWLVIGVFLTGRFVGFSV